VQTSPTELKRHTYMVARLVRLNNNYPLFFLPKPHSRYAWEDIIDRTKNWLCLSSTWDRLCTPPTSHPSYWHKASSATDISPRDGFKFGSSPFSERAQGKSVEKKSQSGASSKNVPLPHCNSDDGDDGDDGDDDDDDKLIAYPYLKDSPKFITSWILHVPLIPGATGRRKRSKKTGAKMDTMESDVAKLDLNK
jgi:hypothetical protein